MTLNNHSIARIARSTKRVEQAITPQPRQRQRRQAPSAPGNKTELICAKHDEELPKAVNSSNPANVVIKAVEVELFRVIPKDDTIEDGDAGDYKLEAMLDDDDEPLTAVVANFSFTDAIAKNEWFWVLPTNGKIKLATVWSC